MIKDTIRTHWFALLLFLLVLIIMGQGAFHKTLPVANLPDDSTWIAPSLYTDMITQGKDRSMVIYGEQLIANTSTYFGPHGTIAATSNGMNCQNCHLDAGTRPWGNNYGSVASTYPKFRPRSGEIENIYKRINDCFQRSLNGSALDTNSYEMQALASYMRWLGQNVPKGRKAYSSGLPALPLLDRAADPAKGKTVYLNICSECHGANGEGRINNEEKSFIYPP
jgi:thiosulfate dehydrogenase